MERESTLSRPNRKNLRSRWRIAALTTAVLVVVAGVGVYALAERAKRPPHFRRGGAFVSAGTAGAAASGEAVSGAATGAPGSSAGAGAGAAQSSTPSSAGSHGVGAPGAGAAAGAPTATTTVPPRTGPSSPSHTPATVESPAGASPTAAGPLPALGTYSWNVQGTESATGFGSRNLPATMTMVLHRDGTLDARQVVADVTYSQDHTEREIVAYRDDGIGFDFEGGQVRFGPMAQTNQGDYRPALLQIPLPASPGTSRTGRSVVTDSNGQVQRTEDWKVAVTGQETLSIAGASVTTEVVKVERQTTADSGQQVHRVRTYWYDPARRLWVKYTEQMHGEQHYAGVAFTYDNNLTAVLAGFRAGAS